MGWMEIIFMGGLISCREGTHHTQGADIKQLEHISNMNEISCEKRKIEQIAGILLSSWLGASVSRTSILNVR